jgi:hypothetical protein
MEEGPDALAPLADGVLADHRRHIAVRRYGALEEGAVDREGGGSSVHAAILAAGRCRQ